MPTKSDLAQIRSEALAKQREQPLDSESRDVKVVFADDKFHISFPKNASLVATVRAIPSVRYDAQTKTWSAPVTRYDDVKRTVSTMREMAERMPVAYEEIEQSIAKAKADADIQNARFDAFDRKDGTTIHPRTTGPILAMNDHYVAQSSGKNYVTIHQRALMVDSKQHGIEADKLEVGQNLSVYYHRGPSSGLVALLSPARTQSAENERAIDQPKPQAGPASGQAPKAKPARRKAAAQEAGPSL